MLSREDNERVTLVEDDTPMGQLMRRYWLPACISGELPRPDCPPIRTRLLGEDLVAFRDSNGRVGVLGEYCAHRRASLFLGRNEECGLRCVYHGWKYDVDGRCVDAPTEADASFKDKVHQLAYPAVEHAGLVWVYMGPPARKPALPDVEWMRAPATHRFVSKTLQLCNYLQAIEGGIDTVHGSFLHRNDLSDTAKFYNIDTAPKLEVERTDYGFRYAGIRDVGEDGLYVRVYQFILPFHQIRPGQLVVRKGIGKANPQMIRGHAWVPVDNHTTMVYNWECSVEADKPLTPEQIARDEAIGGRGPDGEVGEVRRRTRENDWLIDREVQRTKTFTGIAGQNTQDLAVQESMGPIVDRSQEYLGSTDRAITTLRRILLDATAAVASGADAPGVDPATHHSARAVDAVIPHGARWEEALGQELVASW
jgi:phenylpropionate dioxygenase-like ring-hydroxylating dioxygenase large terminal subunit